VVFRGYTYLAGNGVLGTEAMAHYEAQSTGMGGVAMGGRGIGILGSVKAIWDSPVIGHGSWPVDAGYTLWAESLGTALGFPTDFREVGVYGGLIPTHSHILGAWVQAGVLGAIFWLWVLALVVRALFSMNIEREALSPLFIFICLLFIWNIFLSPFGFEGRFETMYFVVAMMYVLESEEAANRSFRGYNLLQSGTVFGADASVSPVSEPARH